MNSRKRLGLTLGACGLTIALAVGCGSDPDKPKLGRVSGTVSYKGKALEKGLVTFIPADGKATQSSVGEIQKDGSYRLTTFVEGDGAPVGTHKVLIQLREEDPLATGFGMPTPEQIAKAKKPKSLIPEKYADPASTPLSFTVKEGSNTIDINLD